MKQFDGPMQVVLSSDWWVDVMAFGINKGIAIQQVQKRMHITPMECAAFGDYMNDAEYTLDDYFSFMEKLQKRHRVKIGIEVCNFQD